MVKRGLDLGVTFLVAADLLAPEILARARPAEQRAVVPVPETAVSEDRGTPARQHHIRFAGQATIVKDEPEPKSMKAAPHYQLGLGILPPDPGHHAAAGGRIDYITRQGP